MKANGVLAILAVMALLLVAGCGIGEIKLSPENNASLVNTTAHEPAADATEPTPSETNGTGNVTAPVVPAKTNTSTAATNKTTPVGRTESTTGDFIAVLQSTDTTGDLIALNLTVKAVEVQNEKNAWVKVSLASANTDVIALGGTSGTSTSTTGRELALNTLPTGIHKAIRLQFATSGTAVGANATTYMIPSEYIIADKPFTVMSDETLVFVFAMDVGKSVKSGTSTVVKPQGTLKLLRGAITSRKSGGLMDVSGGVEVYSMTKTYEELLPAGATGDVTKQCNNSCTASCLGSSSSCITDCKADVKKGCEMGGSSCRDYCDPYISPWTCRDACELASTSTCTHDLLLECSSSCTGTSITPCVNDCVKTCTG